MSTVPICARDMSRSGLPDLSGNGQPWSIPEIRPLLGSSETAMSGNKGSAPEAETDAFECPLSQHSPTISWRSERSAVPVIAAIEMPKDPVEFGHRVVRHLERDAAEIQGAFWAG